MLRVTVGGYSLSTTTMTTANTGMSAGGSRKRAESESKKSLTNGSTSNTTEVSTNYLMAVFVRGGHCQTRSKHGACPEEVLRGD